MAVSNDFTLQSAEAVSTSATAPFEATFLVACLKKIKIYVSSVSLTML